MKVFAPGKLILSGEHSVVYGKPALAMAVDRYVTATATREMLPQILFELSDLAHHSRLSFGGLKNLKARVKRKYHRFVNGDFSIREVLQKPFELAQFALGVFAESLNMALPHGVKIHVQSNIPIGCGMGSSAATILSVMQAVSSFLQVPLSKESLFQLALEAESMQHGYTSGLDLRVALQGGCLFVNGQDIKTRLVPPMTMYLINTGTPMATTGQCVEKVAPHFKQGQLLDDFAAVTIAMDKALAEQSWQQMHDSIRENHQLLMRIGVVPEKVQHFINEVEKMGAAAKVCGAGSITGEQAGAVLMMHPDQSLQLKNDDIKNTLLPLCHRLGYSMIPISGESRGVHAV